MSDLPNRECLVVPLFSYVVVIALRQDASLATLVNNRTLDVAAAAFTRLVYEGGGLVSRFLSALDMMLDIDQSYLLLSLRRAQPLLQPQHTLNQP